MVSNNTTVTWLFSPWSIIGVLSIFFVYTVSFHQKRGCLEDKLCFHHRRAPILSMRKKVLKLENYLRPNQVHAIVNTSLMVLKTRQETRYPVNSLNRCVKTIAVEVLANDIVEALIMKEGRIGIHVKHYIDLIAEGLSTFNVLVKKYVNSAPTTEEFLENVSNALDSLNIGSELITDDLVRIQALDSDPSNAMHTVIRLPYKLKHIKKTSSGRDFRNKSLGDDKTNPTSVTRQMSGYLCNRHSADNQTRRKGFSKFRNWWRPIIGVRDALKHSELWILFLEELSYKTESVELRLEPIYIQPRSLLKGKMVSKRSLTEILFLISKKYNLFSVRRNISKLVETVNDDRLNYLNDILEILTTSKPACTRVHNTTYVESPLVLMSDVLNCSRTLISETSSINIVSVVSSTALLIDQDFIVETVRSIDLDHGKGFHLILMSPEWVVLSGARTESKKLITLNGRKPRTPEAIENMDGIAGLPGEEGGRFYAFGTLFSGGSISIEINGGDGGNGQDGGTSQTITMACYESQASECPEYFCCHGPSTKFVFPGKNGGRQGIEAAPGQYGVFIFPGGSLKKIEFHQNAGRVGEPGRGKKYSILKEGLYPDEKLLNQNKYRKFERNGIERWCHDTPDKGKHVYLPLNEKEKARFSGKDNAAGTPRIPEEIEFGAEKTIPSIRRFRRLSRKHLNIFNFYKLQNFITSIDESRTIRSFYGASDLFDEFKDLRANTKPGYFYREILKLSYHSISARALARKTGDSNEYHTRLYQVLNLASRAKLVGIANPFERILTVNIKEFLAIEKSRILDIKSQMQQQSRYHLIAKAVFSYNSMVQKKFSALAAFINKTINMEMDFLEIELGKSLKDLLDQIKELQNNEKPNVQILKETRRKLESHIIFNRVVFFAKSIGEAVAALWSVGASLSFGVDMTSAFSTNRQKYYSFTPINISNALAVGSSISALRFRRSTSLSLKGFQRQLKFVQVKLKENIEAFPIALETINYTSSLPIFENTDNFTVPLNQFPPKDCALSYKQQLTMEELIRKLQIKVSTAIDADVSEAISVGISGTEIDLIFNISVVAMAVLKENAGVFNKLKDNKIYTEEIARALEKTHEKLRPIQNHLFKMQQNIIPDINNLIIILCRELAGQQSVALMTIRNKMQSAMRDVRLDIRYEFFKGTKLEPYFVRSIQCLRDAVGILISMYEDLDAFREMSKLEKNINDLNFHTAKYNFNTSDASLQKKINELMFSVQGDILLKRQSLVEGAFRMWKFPIVDPILCSFENLSAVFQNFLTHEDVRQYINNIERRIDDMIETVNKSKVSIVDGDKYILQVDFFQSNGFPFYKWENSSWWQFIASILDGQSTFLYSNHFPGPQICEVVKFRQIYLSFGLVQKDAELEAELKAVLNDYLVSLTHEGRSYYLFANQTFVATSEELEFLFSFEVDSDGIPKTRNIVYDKFLRGDITLSPYSMWFIALKPLKQSLGFERLFKFSKKVDMYLEGIGSCVRKVFAVEGNYVSPSCNDANELY